MIFFLFYYDVFKRFLFFYFLKIDLKGQVAGHGITRPYKSTFSYEKQGQLCTRP